MRWLRITATLAMAGGCGPGLGDDSTAEGGPSEPEFADGRTLVQEIVVGRPRPRVDLILVVDDSPSMRPFTETWARNLGAIADMTNDPSEPADMRIAVTTTSVAGPGCQGVRAVGGEPIMESCRAHLQDFVGEGEHPQLGGAQLEDLSALCEEYCPLDSIPRLPSPGHDEHDLDSLAVRPWIELGNNTFGGNLDQVALADALTCAGLQGFAGCNVESPIEAAARMVEHLEDPSHPMFEFRRPDAGLAIVMIGDEDDCSQPASSATIWDPEGERIFWSDPSATAPTSAVCIHAGVECDAQTCTPTDHTLAGDPTQDPSQAVLTSTDRLHDALELAGEFNEVWDPYIASVGGYSNTGEVHYTPPGPDLSDEDQLTLDRFGVLPGCRAAGNEWGAITAGPGGRLARALSHDSAISICEPDWSSVLEVFFNHLKDQLPPSCIEFACVADLEPSAALLTPDCVLEEVDYKHDRTPMPACVRDDAGWIVDPETYNYALPNGADVCWVWLTDGSQQTPAAADDMSPSCTEDERVGEVKIARRPGSVLAYDTHYELRCRPCEVSP